MTKFIGVITLCQPIPRGFGLYGLFCSRLFSYCRAQLGKHFVVKVIVLGRRWVSRRLRGGHTSRGRHAWIGGVRIASDFMLFRLHQESYWPVLSIINHTYTAWFINATGESEGHFGILQKICSLFSSRHARNKSAHNYQLTIVTVESL